MLKIEVKNGTNTNDRQVTVEMEGKHLDLMVEFTAVAVEFIKRECTQADRYALLATIIEHT